MTRADLADIGFKLLVVVPCLLLGSLIVGGFIGDVLGLSAALVIVAALVTLGLSRMWH